MDFTLCNAIQNMCFSLKICFNASSHILHSLMEEILSDIFHVCLVTIWKLHIYTTVNQMCQPLCKTCIHYEFLSYMSCLVTVILKELSFLLFPYTCFYKFAIYLLLSQWETQFHKPTQHRIKQHYLPLASRMSMVTFVVAINFPSVAVTSRI